ncbi:hypothetical protein BC829DRAFT_382212 [Chytridium lagenaria]|nr:hypothetical protein BC829DRAFT_382212 [Chytridium lagenaria]
MFKLTRLRQISITLPRASYQQITDVWVPQLNDLINRVTGYSEIESRKKTVQEKDFELSKKRVSLETSKRIYEACIDERRKCQKEINSLLQGIDSIHMEPGKTRRSQMELKQLIKDTLDALVHTERDGSRGEDVSISHSAAFTESKVQEKDVMSLREKVLKQPEFVFGSGLIVGLCVAGFLSVGE